ncbi:deoxyribodipyrimidine photo-lyase [Bacillus tianshenii]|nr:deoxyribodipyrimidine photo-lyase [Bacillus tianshenii]
MSEVAVVWFRRDFRLTDHHALHQVEKWCEQFDGKWVGFFHLDPYFAEELTPHHDYFFTTVAAFMDRMKQLGMPVVISYGTIDEAVDKLIEQVPEITTVFYNMDEVGRGCERDKRAEQLFKQRKITTHPLLDAHLHRADDVLKKDGTPYQVYTPYYRAWRKEMKPKPFQVSIERLQHYYIDQLNNDSESEQKWEEVVRGCSSHWKGIGETAAQQRWKTFLSKSLHHYHHKRDIPEVDGTSLLSPYLKTGSIGIRQIWADLEAIQVDEAEDEGIETFRKELAWREFYQMVHSFNPTCKDEEITEKYRHIEWEDDEEAFERWCEGRTGFPIVDAAMRQLKATGWMHNRLRMVTASFLTKDLLIDWRKGERYFEKMLIDYDESSNIGGWQWAASVGTDAVPYFRVFNPYRQSERFDPEGAFIRRYVAELKEIPADWVHTPHKAGMFYLSSYPEPIVDHSLQRKRAIELFKQK